MTLKSDLNEVIPETPENSPTEWMNDDHSKWSTVPAAKKIKFVPIIASKRNKTKTIEIEPNELHQTQSQDLFSSSDECNELDDLSFQSFSHGGNQSSAILQDVIHSGKNMENIDAIDFETGNGEIIIEESQIVEEKNEENDGIVGDEITKCDPIVDKYINHFDVETQSDRININEIIDALVTQASVENFETLKIDSNSLSVNELIQLQQTSAHRITCLIDENKKLS